MASTCPVCKTENVIKLGATVCPVCRAELTSVASKELKRSGCVGFLISFSIAVIGLSLIAWYITDWSFQGWLVFWAIMTFFGMFDKVKKSF